MTDRTLTWPNLISALRLILIPFFVIAILERRPGEALIIFLVAGVSDLIDGFIARHWHQQSVLGAYLDPAADKLMMTAALVVLSIPGLHPGWQIPVWITVLLITRDVLIVVIALIVHVAIGVSRFPPSVFSKWNTGFQIIAVIAVLLTGLMPSLDGFAAVLIYIALGTAAVSGFEYGYRFVYRASDLTPEYGLDQDTEIGEGNPEETADGGFD